MQVAVRSVRYAGVEFRSLLAARYAAFFDVCGWKWKYRPIELPGWTPDFWVEFPCSHSECNGSHSLLAAVKPFRSIEDFEGHHCLDLQYGIYHDGHYIADASAAFGWVPWVSEFQMCHGDGAGVFSLDYWVQGNHFALWNDAICVVMDEARTG